MMELPSHGSNVQQLWQFVAAHVEDGRGNGWRKRPCLLAVKAWQKVYRYGNLVSGNSLKKAVFPVVMPLLRHEKKELQVFDWVSKSYTARDLEDHYVRCGHRMSAKESQKVLRLMVGKYERNPTKGMLEGKRRSRYVQRRRNWETGGLYPEVGQPLMEAFVAMSSI